MKLRDLTAGLVGAAMVLPIVATASLTQDNSGMVLPYRGTLELSGSPVSGVYEMEFTFFVQAANGTACHGPVTATVAVVQGEFSTLIPAMDPDCFQSSGALFAEIGVKGPGESAFTPMTTLQRQRIGAVPFAMASTPSSIFAVLGNLGIGTRTPTAALHVDTAWGSQVDPLSGLALFYNATNAPNAHASVAARVAGPGAGDPFFSLDVAGESGWTIGMDNDDGNKLKVTPVWSQVGPAVLTVENNGNLTATGTVSVGGNLNVAGSILATCPAGYSTFDGGGSTLCIKRYVHPTGFPIGWSVALIGCNAEGTRLCTFQQANSACRAGLTMTTSSWLADRNHDDESIMVNSTSCDNMDGYNNVATTLGGGYCCIEYPKY